MLKRYKPLSPRRPKYNNVATTIQLPDGKHSYHSKFEAGYALVLHQLRKEGKLIEVEEQVLYYLEVSGKKICKHIPDFRVTLPDGRIKIVEAKGRRTDTYIIKRRLFEALFPELPYLENPTEKEILQ